MECFVLLELGSFPRSGVFGHRFSNCLFLEGSTRAWLQHRVVHPRVSCNAVFLVLGTRFSLGFLVNRFHQRSVTNRAYFE